MDQRTAVVLVGVALALIAGIAVITATQPVKNDGSRRFRSTDGFFKRIYEVYPRLSAADLSYFEMACKHG